MSNESSENETLNPRRRGLGRGLDALFGEAEDDHVEAGFGLQEGEDVSRETSGAPSRRMISVASLEPGPFQPRRHFDTEGLDQLAESLKTSGMIQPILARPDPERPGIYQIIAGERRWRAAQRARLHDVPVIVQEMDDQTALEIALIENLQRVDLDPIEEARGYRRLMDEFSYDQETAARRLGKSRSHLANTMRLLNLPEDIQKMVSEGTLSPGHARTLLSASDPYALARTIAAEGLSVRAAEKRVAEEKPGSGDKKPRQDLKASGRDPNIQSLEDQIAQALGLSVRLDLKPADADGQQAGSLRIDFRNLGQLDNLLKRLSISQD